MIQAMGYRAVCAAVPAKISFSARHRQPGLSPEEAQFEQLLKSLDVNQWFESLGLKLWRIKLKHWEPGSDAGDFKLKLYVDSKNSQPGMDLEAIQTQLRNKHPLLEHAKLADEPIKRCCHSGCSGCLNYPKQPGW